MADRLVQYKNISEIEVVKSVNETDTVLIERNGAYRRAPSSVVGSAGITEETRIPNPHPLIINSQEYDGSEPVEVVIDAIDVQTDVTLTEFGKPADAGTVGEILKSKISEDDLPSSLPNPFSLIINGAEYDGSKAVSQTISASEGGPNVALDTTLTVSNAAADARAVGDAIAKLDENKLDAEDLDVAISDALQVAKDSGEFDGEKGDVGATGGYYVPSVSNEGDLSWTIHSGSDMPTIPVVNIKGPAGDNANAPDIVVSVTRPSNPSAGTIWLDIS